MQPASDDSRCRRGRGWLAGSPLPSPRPARTPCARAAGPARAHRDRGASHLPRKPPRRPRGAQQRPPRHRASAAWAWAWAWVGLGLGLGLRLRLCLGRRSLDLHLRRRLLDFIRQAGDLLGGGGAQAADHLAGPGQRLLRQRLVGNDLGLAGPEQVVRAAPGFQRRLLARRSDIGIVKSDRSPIDLQCCRSRHSPSFTAPRRRSSPPGRPVPARRCGTVPGKPVFCPKRDPCLMQRLRRVDP